MGNDPKMQWKLLKANTFNSKRPNRKQEDTNKKQLKATALNAWEETEHFVFMGYRYQAVNDFKGFVSKYLKN